MGATMNCECGARGDDVNYVWPGTGTVLANPALCRYRWWRRCVPALEYIDVDSNGSVASIVGSIQVHGHQVLCMLNL